MVLMSDERLQQFYATMEKLRDGYVKKLPARADELAEAVRQWQSGESEARQSVARLVHRLASAGSFGLPEISERAMAIEVQLMDGALYADIGHQLEAFIGFLRSCSPA